MRPAIVEMRAYAQDTLACMQAEDLLQGGADDEVGGEHGPSD